MPKHPEEKRYHVEGSPAESQLTGIVSGETDAKEWTEEQDETAMEKRLAIEKAQEEEEERARKELEERIAEWKDEPTQPG